MRNSDYTDNHSASSKQQVLALHHSFFQLITETPTVPVFIYAALFGPNIVNKNAQLCNWQTVSHFLGLCNASMSFFVYISFSERFRTSMLRYLFFS